MADVATLIARLEKLTELRADGVRQVGYEGEVVVYKSDDEMAAAIRDLERRIANASRPRTVRSVYVNSSKGL